MTIREMPIKEFLEQGYLQEANRLFFHPLGLALAIHIDDDGVHSLSSVWDCRETEGGTYFGEDVSKEKADFVEGQRQSRAPGRMESLGFNIQPVTDPSDDSEIKTD